MKAKDYLSQVRMLDVKIENGMEELMRTKSMATKVTSALSGESVARTRNTDTMTDTIAKIISLQEELNRDVDKFVDLKESIKAVLAKMENPTYFKVLHSRYILYKKWEMIACEMNYSFRGITKIHKKALIAFENILNKEKCS